MKSNIKKLLIVPSLLLVLVPAITANAMNYDYLQREKWISDSKIISEPVNNSSGEYEIYGDFKYYIDEDNFCIYNYFSLSGNNLYEDNEEVRISYTITLPKDIYKFEVDKNGIITETSYEAERSFDVKTVFNSADGVYIVALQYKYPKNEEVAAIEIGFYDGVRKYSINEKPLYIEYFPNSKSTENKESTTKKSKTTTKKNSSKQGTTKKQQTTKYSLSGRYSQSSEGKTQFEPSGNYTSEGSVESNSESTDESLSDALPTKHMSLASKAAAIGAGILAFAGVGLLIGSSFIKDKKKDTEN